MIVFETTVVPLEIDRSDFEHAAITFAMFGVAIAAIQAHKCLDSGDGNAADSVINVIYKRSLSIRDV